MAPYRQRKSWLHHDIRTPTARFSPASPLRRQVLNAIIDYALDHSGATPTLREICTLTGITSTSVASYHVKDLIELGKLTVVDRKLIVVGATWIPPREDK